MFCWRHVSCNFSARMPVTLTVCQHLRSTGIFKSVHTCECKVALDCRLQHKSRVKHKPIASATVAHLIYGFNSLHHGHLLLSCSQRNGIHAEETSQSTYGDEFRIASIRETAGPLQVVTDCIFTYCILEAMPGIEVGTRQDEGENQNPLRGKERLFIYSSVDVYGSLRHGTCFPTW